MAGRVAIVTGSGRGLGRAHALALAAAGASVVVNDVGSPLRSTTGDDGAADYEDVAAAVVAEIAAAGGAAIADHHDVSDFDGARALVELAVRSFGSLHAVVNNAGVTLDRAIVNMTEREWSDVVRLNLTGHLAPTKWAAAYWRDESKAGRRAVRSLVHTSSTSGLFANPGQSNYAVAKSGVATLSQIAAKELRRYGVRSNCVVPAARTRLTLALPGLDELMEPRDGSFDEWDPANASPLVVYLASEQCRVTGQTFFIHGSTLKCMRSWDDGEAINTEGAWTPATLATALADLVEDTFSA